MGQEFKKKREGKSLGSKAEEAGVEVKEEIMPVVHFSSFKLENNL